MNKEIKIKEEIKEIGFELDKRIRKDSNTESEFARKTKRKKATLNALLRSLKDGNGCNITSLISVLTDLNLTLQIVEDGYEYTLVKK